MIEKCIKCGQPTPYSINTPISSRQLYIDGSGQLCEECWNALYPAPPSSPSYSPTAAEKINKDEMEKKEQDEIEKDAKERLRAARKEKPLHRSVFTEAELEKLKVLSPEEYELLK